MTIELQPVTDENFTEWRKAVRQGFGEHVHPDDIARLRDNRVEIDRLVAAVDSGSERIVGTGGVDSYSLTVPGGATVPMAGVAYVTTSVTHRRQGAFSRMMKQVHGSARERGDIIAGLWASQSHLYSRFDYGLAVNAYDWEIEPRFGAFAHSPLPDEPGNSGAHVYFVDAREAAVLLPGIYDRVRLQTSGAVDRNPGRWRYELFDEERVRGGASALFYAICEERGEQTGYVTYRMRRKGDSDMGTLQVEEQMAATDTAHATLWRFLLDFDLVGKITAENRPSDDPLWWMLADPRRLNRKSHDSLWLRLLDVKKVLEARAYNADGRLKIGLVSESQPDIAGTYVLEVDDSRATVRKTTEKPDVVMTPGDLSALFLGGATPGPLVEAGRIDVLTTGALARLHGMFATDSAPWCAHYF
ncbi:MAG: GNAT family N-acetyltransferase [Dehalococcoidia bacterium]|mgnify:CR=1 FL=1|jgi:predicted acetyltransferase|nr:GNAT family N-acetyltransferase [Dehalococcoidia bacterium]